MAAGLGFTDLKLYELTHTLQQITDTTEETTRVGVYVLAEDEAQSIREVAYYEWTTQIAQPEEPAEGQEPDGGDHRSDQQDAVAGCAE